MTTAPSGADLRTVVRLAFRHLVVRRGRALFLLLGYAIGSGVMMVLLSIGEAMLIQSRDVSLVGGGEITVLPEGIDLEGLRTGTMSGLFYGIDRARFVHRQLIGGPRLAGAIGVVSPGIDHQLLYLRTGGRVLTLRASGEIPAPPEPSTPGPTSSRVAGRTSRPTQPGGRRRPNSSTTSSTTSTGRCPIRPGPNGITSTSRPRPTNGGT